MPHLSSRSFGDGGNPARALPQCLRTSSRPPRISLSGRSHSIARSAVSPAASGCKGGEGRLPLVLPKQLGRTWSAFPSPPPQKNLSPPQRDAPGSASLQLPPSPIFPLSVILADNLEPAGFLGRPQLKLCQLPASVPFWDSLVGLQTLGDKTRLHP